jgi:hypothetical protein
MFKQFLFVYFFVFIGWGTFYSHLSSADDLVFSNRCNEELKVFLDKTFSDGSRIMTEGNRLSAEPHYSDIDDSDDGNDDDDTVGAEVSGDSLFIVQSVGGISREWEFDLDRCEIYEDR